MTLFSSLLILFVVYDDVISLIHCKKCGYDFELEEETCDTDCMGTVCYYLEYYYSQPERLLTRKGCISGRAPSNGCRINQNGQMLCLCEQSELLKLTIILNFYSGDFCNEKKSTLVENIPTTLPFQVCKREFMNGIDPIQRWTPPCAGNFCVYKKSMFTHENGTIGYSHSMDCSISSDFDMFFTGLPFLFYPNCCAKLMYGGQMDEVICYGSMPDASEAVFPTEGLIECYADFMSKHLPYIPTRKLCAGQFCVISASPHGDVYRYCTGGSFIM
ncbi:hypothetical protein DICVIV_04851 [Dictyocaulus viviparus]|uniref:DUF7622 domain-containing protein n=1 Tax=Dictyocaulus viviparus TaxID=29172 RepID=A0A0D8XWI5_DICVI|nr:hypothetical protein DICVIV_04851 [Dictyocaulus viviparus]